MIERLRESPALFAATAFLLFLSFSCVGWCYEILNDFAVRGGFHWRSSLAGPWCPIYGIGGLLIIACFKPVSKPSGSMGAKIGRVVAVALGIFVLVSVVELAGSYACEAMMGYVPWDYSTSWGNFDGRVAPEFTVRFVIGGLFFLYVLEPAVSGWAREHAEAAAMLAVLLGMLFVADNIAEYLGIWADILPRDGEVFVLPAR